MNYKYPKSLIAIVLFIFSILNSFAGVYEYEFEQKMFSASPSTVNLGDFVWNLKANDNNNVKFGYSTDNGQKFANIHANKLLNPLTISTSALKDKVINSITITTSCQKKHYVDCWVTVGDSVYKNGNTENPPITKNPTAYMFTGKGKGEIKINWKQQQNSTTTEIYLKKIRIEYEDELPLPESVSISNAGYSTFSSAQAYTMPEGLQGGIVTVSGNTANVNFCYQPGDAVPAEEALMLKGKEGTYTLTSATTSNSKKTENLLKAALTTGTIQAAPGHELFILSRGKDKQLGFFYQYGCNDGSFVKDIAHKAYLDLPTSEYPNVQQGLRLNLEPTGIITPIYNINEKCFYHISGKKMGNQPTALPKGIYIINGKKSIIK